MKHTVQLIQIGLENVEVININVKDVEYMEIAGITGRDTIGKYDKKISKTTQCRKLVLCINKRANVKYLTYGGLSKDTVFERLSRFNDIVDVSYLDEQKNKTEVIYVPWDSKTTCYEENINQCSKIDDDGNLYIVINGAND